MKIGIIGSGKFGLVLARIAAENRNQVSIYSRRQAEVKSLNEKKKIRENEIPCFAESASKFNLIA